MTERKQAVNRLEIMEFAIDHADEGIAIVNKNGSFVYVNVALCEKLDYPREKLLSMSVPDIDPSITPENWPSMWGKIRKTGSFTFLTEHRTRNGADIPVELSIRYGVFNGEECCVTVDRDITERLANEKEKTILQAKLTNAIEIAHLGPWEYDVTEDLFTFNDYIYKIFCTTADNVGGYTMSSAEYLERLVHPDDRHLVRGEIEKTLNTANSHDSAKFEHRIVYPDGTPGYIIVRYNISRDRSGNAVKVYGAIQDISELKYAEQALRKSEKRYRSLIELSPLGIGISDTEGIILMANQTLASMLGYGIEEMVGLNFREITHPDDLKRENELIQPLLKNEMMSFSLEKRYRHRDGNYFWVNFTASKLSDSADGEIIVFGFVENITDRKKMEQEREKLIVELQKALSEIKELRGYLPICSNCKKIRDDDGYWHKVEKYIMERTDAQFSHSICPECAKRLYPDLYDENWEDKETE